MAVSRTAPVRERDETGRPTGPGVRDIGPAAAGVNGLGGRVAGLIEQDRAERTPRPCRVDGCMTLMTHGRDLCRFHAGLEAEP